MRETTLVTMDAATLQTRAVQTGLAVEEFTGKIAVHEQAILVLGTEAVQVEFTGLHLLIEHCVVTEWTLGTLLTPTLLKEFAHNGLSDRLGGRLGLLLLLLFLVEFTVFAFLLHLLLDGLNGDHARGGLRFVVAFSFQIGAC